MEELQEKELTSKARVSKESKTAPAVIYGLEKWEAALMKLGKQSKVELMRKFKKTIARDFKLKMGEENQPTISNQNSSHPVMKGTKKASSSAPPKPKKKKKSNDSSKISKGKKSKPSSSKPSSSKPSSSKTNNSNSLPPDKIKKEVDDEDRSLMDLKESNNEIEEIDKDDEQDEELLISVKKRKIVS